VTDVVAPSRAGPVQRLAAGPVPGTAPSGARSGGNGSSHGEGDGALLQPPASTGRAGSVSLTIGPSAVTGALSVSAETVTCT
jgi:hypothetical protein